MFLFQWPPKDFLKRTEPGRMECRDKTGVSEGVNPTQLTNVPFCSIFYLFHFRVYQGIQRWASARRCQNEVLHELPVPLLRFGG